MKIVNDCVFETKIMKDLEFGEVLCTVPCHT